VYKEPYNVFRTHIIFRLSNGEGSALKEMYQKIKRTHKTFVEKTEKGIQIKIISRKQQ
jgi:hypothetical protein